MENSVLFWAFNSTFCEMVWVAGLGLNVICLSRSLFADVTLCWAVASFFLFGVGVRSGVCFVWRFSYAGWRSSLPF